MREKLLRAIPPLLGLVLFSLAVYVLYNELHEHDPGEILEYLTSVQLRWLLAAFGLTILSYSVLVLNDRLALSYVDHTLPLGRVALTSFISYNYSRTIGFSLFVGGASRYRMYSSLGMSGEKISKVTVFCSLEVWIGFATVWSAAFLFARPDLPESPNIPVSLNLLAFIPLVLMAAYVLWGLFSSRPFRIRSWDIHPPHWKILLGQVVVSSADMMITAGVLYVLLPPTDGLNYFYFLTAFPLAIIAGAISQVPSGLGVFETILILMMGFVVPPTQLLGAIVVYRGIYYLLPLIVSSTLLAITEVEKNSDDGGT